MRYLLVLLIGILGTWLAMKSVFLPPRDYRYDVEMYADGVYQIELTLAKIIADCNENEKIYKQKVSDLCAYKGRLPKGLSTSTSPFPNIIWEDSEKKWLIEGYGNSYSPLH